MKLIDLTLPLYTGMPVYPGDPEASIELVQTHQKEGWDMRRIQINTHDGTHVNAQIHMIPKGKTLDDYPLAAFFGPAKIYDGSIEKDKGVIFRDQNIDRTIMEQIKKIRPRFIGLSSKFEWDVEIERDLLKEDLITFERIANTEQLPNEFMFYALPLNIKG